jgi:hypothetical protein
LGASRKQGRCRHCAAGPATNLTPDSSANLPCDPYIKGGTRREYCRSKKSATTTEKSQSQQNIMDTREESAAIAADSLALSTMAWNHCPFWMEYAVESAACTLAACKIPATPSEMLSMEPAIPMPRR